jgi:ADP-ribose pyrophosphatase YjhB (NUDIX family)
MTAIPRAAVSVAVRWSATSFIKRDTAVTVSGGILSPSPYYLLVQRGNEPNKGMWSLPGGKIESGESTMLAAQRELHEETGLMSSAGFAKEIVTFEENTMPYATHWHPRPFTSSDAIGFDSNQPESVSYHFVISQCFAEVRSSIQISDADELSIAPPSLKASDDAADVRWWTLPEVSQGILSGTVTQHCDDVLGRAEFLYQKGILVDSDSEK